MHKEVIGNATLYLGDCFDIMCQMATYSVDLIVTDPPYGIGESNEKNLTRGLAAKPTNFGAYSWDSKSLEPHYFYEMRRVSQHQIIFGGNYYTDFLRNTNCWIVWDKSNESTDFADCELAWTSFNSAVRKFTWRWNGMLQQDMANKEKRVHPTQKPTPLMLWIVERYSTPEQTILDSFMGSGTTGVACANLKRSFIGIERDPKYFDIACKRIEEAQKQLSLFDIPDSKAPEQMDLLPAG